tara:strand:+ start:1778 stop:2197 length:420 start_codon:yes stop_codon:yes gene_type:complete
MVIVLSALAFIAIFLAASRYQWSVIERSVARQFDDHVFPGIERGYRGDACRVVLKRRVTRFGRQLVYIPGSVVRINALVKAPDSTWHEFGAECHPSVGVKHFEVKALTSKQAFDIVASLAPALLTDHFTPSLPPNNTSR